MRTPTGSRWSSLAPTPVLRVVRALAALALFVPILGNVRPAAADPVAGTQAEANRLAAQIQQLGVRESQLAEAYDRAQLQVEALRTKAAAAQASIAATSSQLDATRARVRDLAVTSYMKGGTAAELEMFIPHSSEELTIRNTYARAVAAGANDAIDALRATHAELGAEQSQLAAEQAAAQKALAAADAARRQAAASDAALHSTLARVQGQLAALVAQAAAQRQAAEAARLEAALAVRASRGSARSTGGSGASSFGGGGPLPPPGAGAQSAVAWARAELGKPYVWGGAGPDSFDCSGLTAWAWGHAGHPLPHSSESQYYVTTHIPVSELQPGDLVFYGMPPHHVGIYVGGGQMINALHSGTNVEYDSIYMEGDLVGGGRVN